MVTEIPLDDADLDIINLPNGCLVRDATEGAVSVFVPDIYWDDERRAFMSIKKRRPLH